MFDLGVVFFVGSGFVFDLGVVFFVGSGLVFDLDVICPFREMTI